MSLESALERVVEDLARRYPRYPVSALERLVQRHADEYADATVTTYVPILVRRAAEAQLRYVQEGIAADMALVFHEAGDGRA